MVTDNADTRPLNGLNGPSGHNGLKKITLPNF